MKLRTAVINKADVNNQPAIQIHGTDLSIAIVKHEDGIASMFTNRDLVTHRLSDEEAFEEAESYAQSFTIRTLQETIGIDLYREGYGKDFSEEVADTYSSVRDVYVLTNEDNLLGAAVLTRQDVLRELHARIGDYYILPSSKHEVLAISKLYAPNVNELRAMVQEINENIVSPVDRLSNNVYCYDGKTLSMAKTDDRIIEDEITKYDGRTLSQ